MTPSLVWDCSVAIAMAFEDERDSRVLRIYESVRYGGALVPAHWPMEIVNVLRVAERRKRIEPSASRKFLSLLGALHIEIDASPDVERDLATLYDVAEQSSLTAYDAAYLRLAQKSGLPLASNDDELNEAARCVGIALA